MKYEKMCSEELARSELDAMERDARHALFCQHHQFQIAVREYQRQARDAVNQAVQESSESYQVLMMQVIQGVQNRYEGRMEEKERRVAQMIGSEAREASRGERNHMLQEHQVLLKSEKKKNSSQEVRCTRRCRHKSLVIDVSYMHEKFHKSTFPKVFKTWNTMRRNEESSHKLKKS